MGTQPEKMTLKSNTMMASPDVCLQDMKWAAQIQDGRNCWLDTNIARDILWEYSMSQELNTSAINNAIKDTIIKWPWQDRE
jgi:hypothetical protein